MTKFFRPAVIILTLTLCVNPLYSQLQTSVKDLIVKRFSQYTESVKREEIYIHTDREYYIAGEEMWFNVYLVYRQGNKPAPDDKLAYIEILNQYNRPVAQQSILLDDGFGPGQIVIPDSLSSGTYTIRAYTNRMKNFLPENCFMKEISIYNVITKKRYIGKKYTDTESDNQKSDSSILVSVSDLSSDSIEIIVRANEQYLSENNDTIYLFIHTNGNINLVKDIKVIYGSARIALQRKILEAGINHLTVFNAKGKPVCERFFYTPYAELHDRNISSISEIKTREKVTAEIDMGNETELKTFKSNLSISVTSCTDTLRFPDISGYLLFGSEFGSKPFKLLRGRKINTLSRDEINSMLLTLKSNWINWEKILSERYDPVLYNPETEGHYLSGKLLNSNSQTPDSGSYVFMSTPGKVPVFQYAKTNSDGNFRFFVRIDDKVKDLVIQPARMDNNSRIKIEVPFSDHYFPSGTIIDSVSNELPEYVSKSGVNYQVSKIYGSSSLGPAAVRSFPPAITKRFYGKPDLEIKIADFINLPVMEEVFFELVKGTSLKKRNEKYELFVMDPVEDKLYDSPPGIFVDGVMFNFPDIIAGLDPDKVESIDLVRDRYYVGDYLFHGIVNVVTTLGDFSMVTLPDYATRLHYKVVDPVLSFTSPDYSKNENKISRVPDFRNMLYWNPSVKPDKNGKVIVDFWSSDIESDYEIIIQGITSEGKLISLRKTFSVKQAF